MGSFESAVSEEAWSRVREIGNADIIVGIPSFKNEATIGHVVSTAAEGLARHFPGKRAVIVDSDGGSPDSTRDVVSRTPVPAGVEKVVLTYQGVPGKGSAFRAIFEIARALGVKGCVVVDSDLRSITPDWIRLLAGPVVDGDFGYVAPLYVRHKYDGTITNSVCYPMTRALYGASVRQPIGGDFGFSAKLLEHYLASDVWETDVARFGIDIWMTTTAVNEGFKLCQASLGAKIHDAKDPAASLGPMFRQVVGTLFGLMKRYESNWRQVQKAEELPVVGSTPSSEPEAVQVTVSTMIDKLRAGYGAEAGFWSSFVAQDNMVQLEEIVGLSEAEYSFPIELWVKIVYDFAAAYNRGDLDPNRVVDSLTGLYYGRTASFCLETASMSTAEAEVQVISKVAQRFQDLRPYLAGRWRG